MRHWKNAKTQNILARPYIPVLIFTKYSFRFLVYSF